MDRIDGKASITIFDDIPRSDTGPALFAESHFRYLNRTARFDAARVRTAIEDWYGRYPERSRKQWSGRFRSPDDRQFLGAFFELYMHEFLTRLDYTPRVDPTADNGRVPDFLCSKGGRSFYLEATVAMPHVERSPGAEKRVSRARDAINTIRSPDFLLWIDEQGAPQTDIPAARLRADIGSFMSAIDYEECRRQWDSKHEIMSLPKHVLQFGGWTIVVRLVPVAPESRGEVTGGAILAWGPGQSRRVDRVTPIRAALKEKAGRYGTIDCPYVIAISTPTERVHHGEVMQALFGGEVWFSTPDNPNLRMRRNPDGALKGRGGPVCRRVSGVVVAPMLTPWSIGKAVLAVYPNPWATAPLGELLKELPGYRPIDQKMEPYEGLGPDEIFGLPESWPDDVVANRLDAAAS